MSTGSVLPKSMSSPSCISISSNCFSEKKGWPCCSSVSASESTSPICAASFSVQKGRYPSPAAASSSTTLEGHSSLPDTLSCRPVSSTPDAVMSCQSIRSVESVPVFPGYL